MGAPSCWPHARCPGLLPALPQRSRIIPEAGPEPRPFRRCRLTIVSVRHGRTAMANRSAMTRSATADRPGKLLRRQRSSHPPWGVRAGCEAMQRSGGPLRGPSARSHAKGPGGGADDASIPKPFDPASPPNAPPRQFRRSETFKDKNVTPGFISGAHSQYPLPQPPTGPCVLGMCQDGCGWEIGGFPALKAVSRHGSPPARTKSGAQKPPMRPSSNRNCLVANAYLGHKGISP